LDYTIHAAKKETTWRNSMMKYTKIVKS